MSKLELKWDTTQAELAIQNEAIFSVSVQIFILFPKGMYNSRQTQVLEILIMSPIYT